MTAKRQPRELPRRRYRLTLTGELAGYSVTMGAMWGRELIALRAGTMDEGEVLDLVARRALEHDFPVDDLRDLDAWMLAEILEAWGEAQKESALPPESGERSPKGSGDSPSSPTPA